MHCIRQIIKKLFEPVDPNKFVDKDNKKSLRWLAWCAIFLGFTVVGIGQFIYGLDTVFTSISASANYHGTAYLLPFVLGCMAIFFWDYVGYENIDQVITKTMSIAAIFVALFQCNEFGEGSIPQKLGFFGLSPYWSNIIHVVAAVILFLSLIIWIVFLFTRTKDKETGEGVWKWKDLSIEKKKRNRIFLFMGFLGVVGLVFAILNFCKVTTVPFVWLGEVIILVSAGVALLVKSGWKVFADKSELAAMPRKFGLRDFRTVREKTFTFRQRVEDRKKN